MCALMDGDDEAVICRKSIVVRGTRIEVRMVNDGKIFFFKDPATTRIYNLSLHNTLPI